MKAQASCSEPLVLVICIEYLMTMDYYFQIAVLNELIYEVIEYVTKSLKKYFSEKFISVPVT